MAQQFNLEAFSNCLAMQKRNNPCLIQQKEYLSLLIWLQPYRMAK